MYEDGYVKARIASYGWGLLMCSGAPGEGRTFAREHEQRRRGARCRRRTACGDRVGEERCASAVAFGGDIQFSDAAVASGS